MGTDSLGRELFARFVKGAGISLLVGFTVATSSAILGTAIGLLGACGRFVDNLVMRLMDVLLAFPPLVLAMAVTVGLGPGLRTAVLGIVITSIPYTARLLRSEVVRLSAMPFVEGATALGARRRRVMFRHVAPHLWSTILVQVTASFGFAVLAVAGVGLVGLGAQIPTAELGTMIADGESSMLTGGWWISLFPGIGLLIAVTAMSVIADRLRDIFDPRGNYFGL